MNTLCKMCGESSDTCVANEDGDLICECCYSLIVREKHLTDKARREARETVWQEQDERSARDGGYKVRPINMRIPQVGEK